MRVILLEDVDKQGEEGDIVNVSKGYALNYLIPQDKAKKATKDVVQQIQKQKSKRQRKQKQQQQQAREKSRQLSNEKVIVKKNSNENGGLYSAVSNSEVVQSIKEMHGVEVSRNQIELGEVKTTGTHKFHVNFDGGPNVELKLEVQEK